MNALATLLIILIVLFHVFAFCMESLFWQSSFVIRAFGTNPAAAAQTRVMALNQGVYNLFLAAGLAWSLIAPDPVGFEIEVFFLLCVAVAGVVGGFSVSKRIFLVQALPAILALALVLQTR